MSVQASQLLIIAIVLLVPFLGIAASAWMVKLDKIAASKASLEGRLRQVRLRLTGAAAIASLAAGGVLWTLRTTGLLTLQPAGTVNVFSRNINEINERSERLVLSLEEAEALARGSCQSTAVEDKIRVAKQEASSMSKSLKTIAPEKR